MSHHLKAAFTLLLLFLFISSARAEKVVIYFLDGSSASGEKIEETQTTIKLKKQNGIVVEILKSKIKKIIDDSPLFIIRKNCRYGWMSAEGKIVIPPAWDEVGDFHDGLALVLVSPNPPAKNCLDYGPPPTGGGFGTMECPGRYGYVNKQGKVIIKPQFCGATDFFDNGLASAQRGPFSWGIINTSGNFVLNAALSMPLYFSDGLMRYPKVIPLKGEELYGFVNAQGKFVIKPAFYSVAPFSEGLALFTQRTKQGFRHGYIDRSGKEVIVLPSAIDEAGDFSEGLAFVCDNKKERCGYIDKSGKVVIPLMFSSNIEREKAFFSGGLALARKGEKFGYIDKSGKFVVPPQFNMAFPFSEGLARVSVPNPGAHRLEWGFIDSTGKSVIPPQFDSARDFSEGLAAVTIEKENSNCAEKTGYIDKTGKFVFELQNIIPFPEGIFDPEGLRSFSDGLAAVRVDYKWGYIDMSGEFVITPQFDRASQFSGGLARVRDSTEYKWGYIDKTGAWAVPPQFEEASSFENGVAFVQTRHSVNELLNVDEYAFIDPTGKILNTLRGVSVEMESAFGEKNFSEGLLPVAATDLVEGFGFLDKSLKFAIAPVYDDVGCFSEGLAAAMKNGKWGFIDKSGKWVIPPQFPHLNPSCFWDGLAQVCLDDGSNCGFVDKGGQMDIPYGHLKKTLDVKAVYYNIDGFLEGLVGFIAEGKGAGFMDKTGKVVIGPDIKFKGGTVMGGGFHEGLASMGVVTGVNDNGEDIVKYGYMDREGTFVIPPKFYTAGAFKNGLAWVGLTGCWHMDGCAWINKKGEIVWKP